jgi:hypothetical protein
MKKLLISLFASLAFSVSASENWVVVQDSDDGETRLLVDSESFTSAKDNTQANSPVYIGAKFRTFENGTFSEFALLTDIISCKKNGGELTARKFVDGAWKTTNRFFWTKSGAKLYDRAGVMLCRILEVRLEEAKPKRKFVPTI